MKEEINKYNSDGNREGYWEWYNSDGALMSKGNYKDGNREGYWERYNSDGIWSKEFVL